MDTGLQTNYKDVIRNSFPFDLLTEEQFTRMLDESSPASFKENEFLFHEEDEEVEVFFLLQGIAKNVLHRDDGQHISVRFYYPGDLIGLMILLAGGQMNFSVKALEDCQTLRFKRNVFLDLMAENEAFSEVVLTGIGDRMKSLYDEIKKERSVNDRENIGLFRTRVHMIMERARTIRENCTLDQAAEMLSEENSAGLVAVNEEGALQGVLTQQHIIRGLLAGGRKERVSRWMEDRPQTIQEHAFSYEVLTFFKDDYIDLVPVMRGESVVGILMAESFLQLQDSKYLHLSYRLQHAETIKELMAVAPKFHPDFHAFTEALLNERTHPTEVCEFISSYNDQLHRKAIQFALRSMKKEGYGPPPINYCFIVMGSQGRREQAFSTDQDNGLILDNYRHMTNWRHVEDYFHLFAAKVNRILADAGFPECSGGIMARERKWCRGIDEWKEEVFRWVRESDSQEIRDFTIFIDYRPVFGDFTLAERLRDDVTERIQHGKLMQAMLMKDTLRFRVPVNPFGRMVVRGKKKTIDIKKAALMQIVNGVRIFAIRYGVNEVSTTARLDALEKLEVFHPRDVKNAKLAMDVLHYHRLKQNLRELRSEKKLTNEIAPFDLEKDDRRQLKEALIISKRLQQMSELSFQKSKGI
jgi:CBS domain-containing protein